MCLYDSLRRFFDASVLLHVGGLAVVASFTVVHRLPGLGLDMTGMNGSCQGPILPDAKMHLCESVHKTTGGINWKRVLIGIRMFAPKKSFPPYPHFSKPFSS